jgi:ferrous-iron efflux pump FieF
MPEIRRPGADAVTGAGGGLRDRRHDKERSVLVGMVLGVGALVPDAIAVVLANSVMLLSDLLKSAAETFATFLSWLTLRRVHRGESFDYNYGQGKLESICSLAVAGAMLVSWLVVTVTAVERLRHPLPLGSTWLGLLVTGLALVLNVRLWKHNRFLAQESPSPIIESQWRLYRTKAVANACVLASLGLGTVFRGQGWATYLDPAGAIVISGFLLVSAYRVVSDSFHDLLDRTLDESLQLIIVKALAARYDDYEALHGVRSRRSGSNIYIEIFMEFAPERRMSDVQAVIDRMKADLEAKIHGSQVVIAPATRPVR